MLRGDSKERVYLESGLVRFETSDGLPRWEYWYFLDDANGGWESLHRVFHN
jgi:hypothetical protein